MLKEPDLNLTDPNVLVVDDTTDSGLTLSWLLAWPGCGCGCGLGCQDEVGQSGHATAGWLAARARQRAAGYRRSGMIARQEDTRD